MSKLRTSGKNDEFVELARDQAWIYLKKTGRAFFLEIHHDGGPWGADREIHIPLTRKQANEIEVACRGRR